MSPLTPRQKKVLDIIENHIAREGYAPSQQEIGRAFGFRSLGTVQNYGGWGLGTGGCAGTVERPLRHRHRRRLVGHR